MMNAPGKIYSLIPKVMSDLAPIAKAGRNEEDGYVFQKVDDVCNALQPLLAGNGVFFTPTVVKTTEERLSAKKGQPQRVRVLLEVKYTIFADDGSFIESTVNGEAIDESDKASNKALTAALKAMLRQVFCIAVKDGIDAEQSSPELNFRKEKQGRENSTGESEDLKIADGKYRGKMASKIPRKELAKYIKDLDAIAKDNGMNHPQWFLNLQKWATA